MHRRSKLPASQFLGQANPVPHRNVDAWDGDTVAIFGACVECSWKLISLAVDQDAHLCTRGLALFRLVHRGALFKQDKYCSPLTTPCRSVGRRVGWVVEELEHDTVAPDLPSKVSFGGVNRQLGAIGEDKYQVAPILVRIARKCVAELKEWT
jgi:hypothetical protein